MKSVVQDWLSNDNISYKQQTVVLSSLRGCDGLTKEDISKRLVRKIRNVVLKNAGTKNTPFMIEDMSLDDIKNMLLIVINIQFIFICICALHVR